MAHNKLYRNFIILQEDERGYSHSNDKALSGYAKVEAKGDKCKVSFYAQNLKKEDNYSMVLICCKRDLKQLIDIGPLAVNEVGKGDTSREYYINNIAGLGISYEKISGAAICKVNNNEPQFVMHGFMNGEDSTDNWRRFKLVRVDSKKYSNKIVSEPDVTEKKSTVKSNLQDSLIDRKKEDSNINIKENIQLENKTSNNYQNIVESTSNLEEDRNKYKDSKKHEQCEKHEKCEKHDKHDECGKHDKYEKCDECEKHDVYDKDGIIEETINKLGKKLESYGDVINLKIGHLVDDVVIYGFIKEKKDLNCKWKKFKLEKKGRSEEQGYNNIPISSRRIEENFNLDRMDVINFDEYENKIQPQGGSTTPETGMMGQTGMETGTGTMNQTQTGPATTENMPSAMNQPQTTVTPTAPSPSTMGQAETTVTPPTPSTTMGQAGTSAEAQNAGMLDFTGMEQPPSKIMPQSMQNQGFTIKGEIGLYFDKLAEGFEPYFGNLTDINHCKWYKINVNNIDDLSDESNYNQYTLAYYPMLNYYPYISKKGHFLMGYKCNGNGDMKYIVYAVPGSKEKNDQPYGGRTGFVTWTSDDNNGQGYWLMFYDFKNSTIVIPTK